MGKIKQISNFISIRTEEECEDEEGRGKGGLYSIFLTLSLSVLFENKGNI